MVPCKSEAEQQEITVCAMKKNILLIFLYFFTILLNINAQDSIRKRAVTGFNGGMMLHVGYVAGTIGEAGYKAAGCPFGIGGVIRLRFGKHFMLGSEGYVSTLKQGHNGSYIKYGWGGLLGEFYWEFKHVAPYFGLTVGGGANTVFLLRSGSAKDWLPEHDVLFHRQGFAAVVPFAGCDFIVTKAFHLTLKTDLMNCFSKGKLLQPSGPRFYFGFIFNH